MRCRRQRLVVLLAAAWAVLGAHAAVLPTTKTTQERGLSLASLLGDIPNLGDLIDEKITVLTELVKTLKSGQAVQNDIRRFLVARARTLAHGTSVAARSTTAADAAANDVSCPSVVVLFARGTAEPGNVGFLAGPPFFTALRNYVAVDTVAKNIKTANSTGAGAGINTNTTTTTTTIAVQGVDYPATIAAFLAGGSPYGGAEMARLAMATAAACPRSALTLAGYSGGALVVRLAAQILATVNGGVGSGVSGSSTVNGTANGTANVTTDGGKGKGSGVVISSVVLFGDPMNGTAVAGVVPGRVLTACHARDRICTGGMLVLPAHLNYASDAAAAAMFVMQRSGLGLASADAMMQGMGNVPTMANPSPNTWTG